MRCIDQDVPIENANELTARREDSLVVTVRAGAPDLLAPIRMQLKQGKLLQCGG